MRTLRAGVWLLVVLALAGDAEAANRFFVNGGVDNNWGTTGNWSLTSGGAGGVSVPSPSDAVFLDANSPNCIVNTFTRNAASLTATGYTNTITFNAALTVSGAITLAPTMTLAGSSSLGVITGSTLTTNGKTINVPFTMQPGNATVTISGPATFSALLTFTGGSGATMIFNGDTMTATSSVTIANRIFVSGTSTLILAGTGTFTRNNLESNFQNNIEVNTAGTITFAGLPGRTLGTLTITSGTIAGSLVLGGGVGSSEHAYTFVQ